MSVLPGNGAFERAVDVAETADAIDATAEIVGCDAKDFEVILFE